MGEDNDREKWNRMKSLYGALFSDAIPQVPGDVPPLLESLFHATRREGVKCCHLQTLYTGNVHVYV